ncbi:MAG: hypothetical protein AAFV80_01080 [Bacteroidota bacterium]
MKYIFLCFCLGLGVSTTAQELALKPLHDPRMHAGCYVEDVNGEVVINLSEEDGKGHPYALIRLGEEDLSLRGLRFKGKKNIFGNDKVKIKVKYVFLRKELETCIELMQFVVKIKAQRKRYQYILDGFCGC